MRPPRSGPAPAVLSLILAAISPAAAQVKVDLNVPAVTGSGASAAASASNSPAILSAPALNAGISPSILSAAPAAVLSPAASPGAAALPASALAALPAASAANALPGAPVAAAAIPAAGNAPHAAAGVPAAQISATGKALPAASISSDGEAARGANALGRALAPSDAPDAPAPGASLSHAFDGTDLKPSGDGLTAAPVGEAELSARASGAHVWIAPYEAGRLGRLGAETAQLRAVRAAKGESALKPEDAAVLRGIDDLAKAVALGDSTPQQIAAAARVVETMDIKKLKRFSALAGKFITTEVPGKSSPFALAGNVEHVEQQLIEPLTEDGPSLAKAFKTDAHESEEHFVEMLRALQYATDTGKQQNPDDMGAALARFNSQADTGPNWYINNFILPHEYASMMWVETLGKEAGMTERERLAFSRLIANHNFGPDLTDPKNAAMREHWWPKSFRGNTLPMLKAMGIDVAKHFKADETGMLQYGHAQNHPLTLLLSVYDRAIAVSQSAHRTGNGSGLATWKKYGIQDFNGKKGRLQGMRKRNQAKHGGELLESDPAGAKDEDGKAGPIFEFDGPSVVRAMESAAGWAEQHVESLWASLYDALPADSPARREYLSRQNWRNFPPFRDQRKAIGFLNGLLRVVKDSNPEGLTNRADVLPGDGKAYYQARSEGMAGIYRVSLERTGPGAFDPRSTDYSYAAKIERLGRGTGVKWEPVPAEGAFAGKNALATTGVDPVALFIDLIRADQEKLVSESPRGPPGELPIFAPAPSAFPAKSSPDVAAARQYVNSIAAGVKLNERQTDGLLEQFFEEQGIAPGSARADGIRRELLPSKVAAEDKAVAGLSLPLQKHRASLLRIAAERKTTPAGIEAVLGRRGVLDAIAHLGDAAFTRQTELALQRDELERAVAGYPDTTQGRFMREIAGHMATASGKSVEEVARDGVFAYVDFAGNSVVRATAGRDPDVRSVQVVFYVTRRGGRWKIDGYRQNRGAGRADAELVGGLKKWLAKGGVAEKDFE